MMQHFSFTFFPFFDFATQLLSTPIMSSNLRNHAPLFAELRLLQATKNTSNTLSFSRRFEMVNARAKYKLLQSFQVFIVT